MSVLQCSVCGCYNGFDEYGDHTLCCVVCGHGEGDARKLKDFDNCGYWGSSK
ncbi:unnamed protein product [marine sediment metagenome]|uniref:Uncharacterized protein n=1 Tax=marine sediment metagenome TaxID=412755 RepID=X1B385_9ZZZZ